MEGNGAEAGGICGGGARIGRGGGNKGKQRLLPDEEEEAGMNENGIGGKDGAPPMDP